MKFLPSLFGTPPHNNTTTGATIIDGDDDYTDSFPKTTTITSASPSENIFLASSKSDRSTDSDMSSNICDYDYNGSLRTQLSLQTLPSIHSLQSSPLFLPYPTPISISISYTTSIKPTTTISPITSLSLSGPHLYTASAHHITVYDSSTLAHLHTFNDHNHKYTGAAAGSPSTSGSVKSIVFTVDGKIFTAHQDGKIRVWRKSQNNKHLHCKLMTTLPTFNDRLFRYPLPNNYLQVRRHKKRLWIEHHDAVSSLAVHEGLIYSVSWDKYLKIWRSKDFKCLESVKAHDDAINAVIVSQQDGLVYTGSADRRIRVWAREKADEEGEPNAKRKRRHHHKLVLVATLEKHKSGVNALALSSDGLVLFSGACDRSILVWEKRLKDPAYQGGDNNNNNNDNYMMVSGALRGHDGAILCLINVSDFLISGSADRTVRIWRRRFDDQSFCSLTILRGHVKPVRSLTADWISEEEDEDEENTSSIIKPGVIKVFSGSLDGEIKIWKVKVSTDNFLISD